MSAARSFFPKKDARIGKRDFPGGQSRAEGRAAKAPDGVGIQNAKEKAAKESQTRPAPPCSVIHPGGSAHVTRTQRFHRPPGRQSRSGYGIRRFRRHFHRRGSDPRRRTARHGQEAARLLRALLLLRRAGQGARNPQRQVPPHRRQGHGAHRHGRQGPGPRDRDRSGRDRVHGSGIRVHFRPRGKDHEAGLSDHGLARSGLPGEIQSESRMRRGRGGAPCPYA